jgi:hypothetical protein
VPVKLAIVTHCLMANRAQVKLISQFVCFFRPQVSTFKNEIENIKIRHKKKNTFVEKKNLLTLAVFSHLSKRFVFFFEKVAVALVLKIERQPKLFWGQVTLLTSLFSFTCFEKTKVR